jgi:hypothetical protein
MKSFKLLTFAGLIILLAFSSAKAQDAKSRIRAAYDKLNKRDYAAFTKLVTLTSWNTLQAQHPPKHRKPLSKPTKCT